MHTRWFFAFFAVSGFCSLIYEVVWLRLAMADFGVTTPMVSLVLSLFMAGLGVGSVLAGRLAQRGAMAGNAAGAPLRSYALIEGLIGLSSVLVPLGFARGRDLLGWLGTSWGSGAHYWLAGLVLAVTMLPFGVCMGATFPLAMTAMRRLYGAAAQRSFSYLYLANLIGATLGTLGSAFVLIELFGFKRTLMIAGGLNLLLCAAAYWLSRRLDRTDAPVPVEDEAPAQRDLIPRKPGATLGLLWLLLTGLCSMAMEVVWTRLYLTYVGTLVYAFAAILAIYLGATFVGSQLYRIWVKSRARFDGDGPLWLFVVALGALLSLLPLLAADPRLARPGFLHGLWQVLIGIAPFCASLGFLTPLLVDRYAEGQAQRAGVAYAVNIIGCIVGPLLAGFVLLPHLSERLSILLLAALLFLCALYTLLTVSNASRASRRLALALCLISIVPAWWLAQNARSPMERFPLPRLERRDYTATTIAWGRGMAKHLTVNGIGMTTLTPITKMMVHLPLALHRAPPRNALVICFGMGTSYRSALSWGIEATAVELVPSVPGLIGFYHQDGDAVLHAPKGRVVIDDGRRFLSREAQSFDVIIIDPPPPIEAAGSSLLYTTEMYEAARRRLAPGGILQQWFPVADPAALSAVTRALAESFPHLRIFRSIEGWGFHFLASMQPIEIDAAAILESRMPDSARRDLVEWGPRRNAAEMLQVVLDRPILVEHMIKLADVPTMRDDRPVNEYYLLRRGKF